MTQTWPPSPCVEDEEVALAKEHVLDVAHQVGNENQPASNKGSIDQYPIILDKDDSPQLKDSVGPVSTSQHTDPLAVNMEKRFVLVHSDLAESQSQSAVPHEPLQRSKSTTQLRSPDESRGRPQVSRIHTDLGADLDALRTGQRRAPSPYTHTPQTSFDAHTSEPRRKETLLSPLDAHDGRRPTSRRPETRVPERDSSDSDQKRRERRRPERSRSRAARQSFSHSDRSESEKIKRSKSTRRDDSDDKFAARAHRYRSPAPRPGAFRGYTYTGQDHITPPATPKPTGESARSSATDHSNAQDLPARRHHPMSVNTDSPNTSSAEESHKRRSKEGDESRSSRSLRARRSVHLRDDASGRTATASTRARSQRREDNGAKEELTRKQQSTDDHARHGAKTPISGRTPLSMEGLLENAFARNRSRHSRALDNHSRQVSPSTSPAQSPPQTPRGDRSPRDYFDLTHHPPKSSRQRSRPPSVDESSLKDLKHVSSSLLGVATLGASLAAKAIPALSRSSTSQSLETPSSSSQSRPNSGQRSRKPSPLLEESQPAYQSQSRANSVTGRDDSTAIKTTTYTVHEERKAPSAVPNASTPLETPRAASRASSYSHSPEQSRPPGPFRAYTTQGYHTSTHAPIQLQPQVLASPSNPDAAFAPTRPISAPACPRSRPVAGLRDWYTIRDMSFLSFCPTCMSFLGSTRFRDHFIPSHGKDPRQPTACAMSYPWLRIAWLQSVKQDRKDLGVVWSIACGPPAETKMCAGSKSDIRRWYHLVDPRTKKPVDNFDICSACVRNIDLIFPKLKFAVFDRPQDKKEVEKICNMNTFSRHFYPVMAELERLSDRSKETVRHRDFQDFVDYIRRISRIRQCVRDTLLATQSWHFHSELPEFTICEECYEEVVWPLRDRPIARDISKTLKLVPSIRKSSMLPGTSCQLYSDRMRRTFRDAVNRNDFESLKSAAQYRYHTEHRLQEMHKYYEMDQQAGIDRRTEMEKNIGIWKSIE
jgi:hypothetical protein